MRSPFFPNYLRRSLTLWAGLKIAIVFLSAQVRVPDTPPDPFGYHLIQEVVAIVVAWLWLGSIMRRNGEDILLANLGFPVKLIFLQLVLLFTGLSLLVSLLA